jgi:hypothetical protein
MTAPREEALLTLEPLIDAVRAGVETVGWKLSGLQKTTSHQFEGRWEGDSTRSAYLFFHPPHGPDFASVDVYLDETTQGLTGNLALVVDLAELRALGDTDDLLHGLGKMSSAALPSGHPTPVTLRLRLDDGLLDPGEAEVEVRFKLRLTRRTIGRGAGAIRDLAAETVKAFEGILGEEALLRLTDDS